MTQDGLYRLFTAILIALSVASTTVVASVTVFFDESESRPILDPTQIAYLTPSVTPIPTPTQTPTNTPTNTPTPTNTQTNTPTSTFTPSPTNTPTAVPPVPTNTPIPPTNTPTPDVPNGTPTAVLPAVAPTATFAPPATSLPAPIKTDIEQKIIVDLSQQYLWAYEGERVVSEFVVSTGQPGAGTAVGSYKIQNHIPMAWGSTWGIQMPHWMGIYWAGHLQNGFHGLPINPDGSHLWEGYIGTPISYGCIVMTNENAKWLYDWAAVGADVVIRP